MTFFLFACDIRPFSDRYINSQHIYSYFKASCYYLYIHPCMFLYTFVKPRYTYFSTILYLFYITFKPLSILNMFHIFLFSSRSLFFVSSHFPIILYSLPFFFIYPLLFINSILNFCSEKSSLVAICFPTKVYDSN